MQYRWEACWRKLLINEVPQATSTFTEKAAYVLFTQKAASKSRGVMWTSPGCRLCSILARREPLQYKTNVWDGRKVSCEVMRWLSIECHEWCYNRCLNTRGCSDVGSNWPSSNDVMSSVACAAKSPLVYVLSRLSAGQCGRRQGAAGTMWLLYEWWPSPEHDAALMLRWQSSPLLLRLPAVPHSGHHCNAESMCSLRLMTAFSARERRWCRCRHWPWDNVAMSIIACAAKSILTCALSICGHNGINDIKPSFFSFCICDKFFFFLYYSVLCII